MPQGSRPLLQCRYFSLEFSTFRKKVNEGCLTKSSWRTHCPAQIYRNVSVCSYTAMPLSCTLSFSRFTKRFHLSLGTENLLIMLERIILSLDVTFSHNFNNNCSSSEFKYSLGPSKSELRKIPPPVPLVVIMGNRLLRKTISFIIVCLETSNIKDNQRAVVAFSLIKNNLIFSRLSYVVSFSFTADTPFLGFYNTRLMSRKPLH